MRILLFFHFLLIFVLNMCFVVPTYDIYLPFSPLEKTENFSILTLASPPYYHRE